MRFFYHQLTDFRSSWIVKESKRLICFELSSLLVLSFSTRTSKLFPLLILSLKKAFFQNMSFLLLLIQNYCHIFHIWTHFLEIFGILPTIKFSIERLVFFKNHSKIQMLQSILAFHHESNVVFLLIQLFFHFPQSVLNLPKDTYEDYLAFLFEVTIFLIQEQWITSIRQSHSLFTKSSIWLCNRNILWWGIINPSGKRRYVHVLHHVFHILCNSIC